MMTKSLCTNLADESRPRPATLKSEHQWDLHEDVAHPQDLASTKRTNLRLPKRTLTENLQNRKNTKTASFFSSKNRKTALYRCAAGCRSMPPPNSLAYDGSPPWGSPTYRTKWSSPYKARPNSLYAHETMMHGQFFPESAGTASSSPNTTLARTLIAPHKPASIDTQDVNDPKGEKL